MIHVEQFKAEHMLEIEVQQAQELVRAHAHAIGPAYEGVGNGYTLRHRGRIVACAGFAATEIAPWHLWAVVAARAPLLVLHRAAGRLIEVYRGHGRVVATTEATFAAGCRWLELLGFERERRLTGWGFGVDHMLYSREL